MEAFRDNVNAMTNQEEAMTQPINISMTNTEQVRKKGINHPLHIVLSLLTGGVWMVLVYLPLLIFKRR